MTYANPALVGILVPTCANPAPVENYDLDHVGLSVLGTELAALMITIPGVVVAFK